MALQIHSAKIPVASGVPVLWRFWCQSTDIGRSWGASGMEPFWTAGGISIGLVVALVLAFAWGSFCRPKTSSVLDVVVGEDGNGCMEVGANA